MLPFFRKIRYRLAENNQFFKYSRYAIGEIVLVVVGILIALQINNWNEARKKTNTEIEYLIRLRSDLANDTAYYHRRIKYSDKVITDHRKAVEISHTEIKSPQDFSESFKDLELSSEALSIRDITYNEMLNAGQINIIRNDTIRTEILEFYRQVDLVNKHFEEVNATSIEFMKDFFIQSKSFKQFWLNNEMRPWSDEMIEDSVDWQWINDPESESFKSFHFTLGFYSMKQNMFKGYFEDLDDKSKFLIEEIEKELTNRSIGVPEPNIEPVFVLE
jgi:hypothetical protein